MILKPSSEPSERRCMLHTELRVDIVPTDSRTGATTAAPTVPASASIGGKVSSRQGASCLSDPREAVTELLASVDQPNLKLAIVFVSSRYDLQEVAAALRNAFSCPVLACTTSGEIGPRGLGSSGMVAVSLAGAIDAELHTIDLSAEGDSLRRVITKVASRASRESLRHSWCLVLHDGMAGREEYLNAALQDGLVGTRLIGGSAGDDLGFQASHVLVDGEFRTAHSAILHLVSDAYLQPIKIQHFSATDRLLVVTAADPEVRRIREINGLPAAEVYSSQIGVAVAAMTPAVFSQFPFVVEIDGDTYVRSIRAIESDGSLVLYCAIEVGVLCCIGSPLDPLKAAERAFDNLVETVGKPEVVIGFDCILRGLEAQANGFADALYKLYSDNRVLGFHTYGETIGRLHVNQTFTGLAIGGQ